MLSLSECFCFPFGSLFAGKTYRESPASGFLAGGCPLRGFPGVALAFPRDYPFCQLLWLVWLSVRHAASCRLFCWLPTHHMSSQSDAVLKLAMVSYVWVCCNKRWTSQYQTQAAHCPLATSALSSAMLSIAAHMFPMFSAPCDCSVLLEVALSLSDTSAFSSNQIPGRWRKVWMHALIILFILDYVFNVIMYTRIKW